MRVALAAVAAATPAAALSIGPPDCHAFDRGLRDGRNTAVVRVEWVGETRREADGYVTPLRAVVEEVVKGRDIRRDQVLAWQDRVDDAAAEAWGGGAPSWRAGTVLLATVEDDGGEVRPWLPLDFYEDNLRTCYRRSLVSRAD